MIRKYVIHVILFFIPIIGIITTLELLSMKLPLRYTYIANYLGEEEDMIEYLVLGTSQMKDAVNPDWLSNPAINLSSTNQNHDTDYKLYQGVKSRLPKLNTVILELSYPQLENLHNSEDFWKNNVFLKYYNINCFDRRVWPHDRFIYLSNPSFYSKALYKHYVSKNETEEFNGYGYDLNNFSGIFNRNSYDESRIASLEFVIPTIESKKLFKKNTEYLFMMLKTFSEDEMNVIIVTTPLYKDYLVKRNPEILSRRDSILNLIPKRFNNVTLFEKESDTTHYKVTDFLNFNHLNTDGARKFTKSLDLILND